MNYELPDSEKEAMLRRAFVDHRADYIVISSRREWRQIESANYGVARGWLKSEWHEEDEQSAYVKYRLTPEGRKYFGLGAA
jgi:hypothetical protein